MWALVESNSISKIYTRPTALQLGDIQYPQNIFSLWSEAELNAIGIYSVTVDQTNFKDKEYYQNTDVTYTYNSDADTVTGAYATATANTLADLKTRKKTQINSTAHGKIVQYDWYTLRATDGGTAVPSAISTYRAAIRTDSNDMCTLVDNAANIDALAALYVYSANVYHTYTAEDEAANPAHVEGTTTGVIKTKGTRPLGEWTDEPS